MSEEPTPSDAPGLDEDLVAYLDGELDDPASRRLEERLATDAAARARLRALATSWDLLDHLPRAALDESFTRTTVQMVAVAASEDVAAETATAPARRRRRWTAGAIAATASAIVGFAVVVAAWPDPNDALLRDLPVVKNFELYDVIPRGDAIEFLRRLEKEELFIGDASDQSESPSKPEPTGDDATREVLAERRAEVEALDNKAELRKLFERFKAKSEEEKERLRALDAELRAAPDEVRLRRVLESYYGWLPTLSPLERNELPKMSIDGAIAEVQRLKQLEIRGLARSDKFRQGPLTPRDVAAIERWQQERAWRMKDQILEKASSQDREWFDGLPEERKKRSLMFMEPGPPRPPKLDAKEWDEMLNQVPAVKALFASQGKGKQAEEALKAHPLPVQQKVKEEVAKATSIEDQQRLLFGWQMNALRARDAVGGGVDPKELQRFLNEVLSKEKREELSLLPPEEFHRKLRFEYFVKMELPPGRFRPGGWGRGRDGGRGRSDDERRRHGDGGGSSDRDDDSRDRRDDDSRDRRDESRHRDRGD
jgi:hypothetical protein